MIFSANSNMYKVNAESTLAVYGSFVEGTGDEVVVLLSARQLSPIARSALEKSLSALGYGNRCCACVTLAADGADMRIGANDLLSIVEGLDPLVIVAADSDAAAELGRAYHLEVAPDSSNRLMGRTVIAFRSFEDQLATPDAKQRAWALLKKIPRLS